MKIFDGKMHAQIIEETLLKPVVSKTIGRLIIVQIGDNDISEKYINLKRKLCIKLEIPCEVARFDTHLSKYEIASRVLSVLNNDKNCGVIIQLPLPDPELNYLLNTIPYSKDIDLLSDYSQEMFYSGNFTKFPPVVRAVDYFLKTNKLDPKNMKICVIGNGFLVGKPVSFYLGSLGASVKVIEDYAKGMKLDCDVVVLSAGIPNLVDGSDFREGCHVIDFGSSVVEGKTVGDLDKSTNLDHLGVVSMSPGGMGPLVVRFLVYNHLKTSCHVN